jgi:pantetheine-phosphate adenylyltransferase
MSIAVYAGTFDPITAGHLSVIRQAARIFAHVRVLVAHNPLKQTLFEVSERLDMIAALVRRMPQVSVDATDQLVVAYAQEIGASYLVRGIRGASDATFETELAQANRGIAPEIATVLLPAEPHLSSLSSSALKQRVRQGQDVTGDCPAEVARRLRQRLSENQGDPP